MNLYNSETYKEDLKYLTELDLPWEKLDKVETLKKYL